MERKSFAISKNWRDSTVTQFSQKLSESSDELKIELLQLNAQLILPCIFKDELIGFILLGKKANKLNLFTLDDLTLIELLTSEFGAILGRILTYLKIINNLEKKQISLSVAQLIHEYIHEIKNPLTVIEGITSSDEENSAEIKDTVLKQSIKIKKLVSNILKISNEQRKRDLRLVNINLVIDSTIVLFSDLGKKIKDLDPNLPEIYGDYEDLQILFTNLFKNAKEAMSTIERNTREIIIKTKWLNETNEIYFSVADKGVGIPTEKLEKIWEKYKTSKSNSGGTGLGLSIIKRIITEHQGLVDVTSKSGTGTCFHFWIKIEENKKEYLKSKIKVDP